MNEPVPEYGAVPPVAETVTVAEPPLQRIAVADEDADTALGAQVLLATLTFNAAAFPGASNGVLTAAAITSDSSIDATGTAAWARIATSGGTTIMDVTVGTSGEDINFNTVSFVTGASCAISSLTITMPKT